MEYLRLGDLARFRERDGPLPEKISGLIVRQVLEGIKFMHEINFAHRDLKPGVSSLFSIFNPCTHSNVEHLGSNDNALDCQNCRFWHQQTVP
jgi:serine/threonine protein kinase